MENRARTWEWGFLFFRFAFWRTRIEFHRVCLAPRECAVQCFTWTGWYLSPWVERFLNKKAFLGRMSALFLFLFFSPSWGSARFFEQKSFLGRRMSAFFLFCSGTLFLYADANRIFVVRNFCFAVCFCFVVCACLSLGICLSVCVVQMFVACLLVLGVRAPLLISFLVLYFFTSRWRDSSSKSREQFSRTWRHSLKTCVCHRSWARYFLLLVYFLLYASVALTFEEYRKQNVSLVSPAEKRRRAEVFSKPISVC